MSELSRLRWLCRRGMKELDILMSGYLDNHYLQASQTEQQSFKLLLEMQDPDLLALIVGRDSSDDPNIVKMVQFLANMISRK